MHPERADVGRVLERFRLNVIARGQYEDNTIPCGEGAAGDLCSCWGRERAPVLEWRRSAGAARQRESNNDHTSLYGVQLHGSGPDELRRRDPLGDCGTSFLAKEKVGPGARSKEN